VPEPLQRQEPTQERPAVARPAVAADYQAVTDERGLEGLAQELAASGGFSLDVETTSLDPMLAELVGISFSIGPGHGRYVLTI